MRVALVLGLLAFLLAAGGAAAFALTRDTSVSILVDGSEERVPEGSTLGEALDGLGLDPPAGDMLSVTGAVLRRGAYPARVLVNGMPASPATELVSGDRLGVVAGRTRTEPTRRVVLPVAGGLPANPQYTLARYPAKEVEKGRISGELDEGTIEPSGVATPPNAVALTFDDGPARDTRAILETLRRLNVPATFFFIGNRVVNNPKLVRRAFAYGMAVENHSYSHPYSPPFNRRSRADVEEEITRGTEAITAQTVPPKLFRPPGGTFSPLVEEVARSHGQRLVLWSVDPGDWKTEVTARQIVKRVLDNVKPGSIVLLHDGPVARRQTVKALPAIVKGIRAKGLRLVLVEPG